MTETRAPRMDGADGRQKRTKRAGSGSGSSRSDREPLIAFVHVPKTAGATLKSALAEVFGRGAMFDAGNYLRDPVKTASQSFNLKPRVRVVVGHLHYGLLREHLPRETRYITLLREPIDRVVSHYHRHLGPKVGPLPEALERGMPDLTNLMTRFVSGLTEIRGRLPNGTLEQAKANLERFEFVGFQERFDESLLLLQEKLGLPSLEYGASRHVNEDRPSVEDLSEEDRAAIAYFNGLDIDLYEWARRRFDAEVETRSGDLADAVARIRSRSAAKVETQVHRTKLAMEWLEKSAATATKRPMSELKFDAEAAGFTVGEVQRARHELAVQWLRSALPPGTSRPVHELAAEAELVGLTLPDLQTARRHLRPACAKVTTPSGVHWAMERQPHIAFVHIPATNGEPVEEMLTAAFGQEAIHFAGNYIDHPRRTAATAGKLGPRVRATVGQVHVGLLGPHLPPDTRYITILRDPCERVWSHAVMSFDGDAMRLAEALEQGVPDVTNLTVRFLCGHPEILGTLPDTALEDAMEVLESFLFVGFHDRLDEAVAVLHERLSIPLPTAGIHLNGGDAQRERVNVSAEVAALIHRHNRLDAQLYAWARHRFGAATAQ